MKYLSYILALNFIVFSNYSNAASAKPCVLAAFYKLNPNGTKGDYVDFTFSEAGTMSGGSWEFKEAFPDPKKFVTYCKEERIDHETIISDSRVKKTVDGVSLPIDEWASSKRKTTTPSGLPTAGEICANSFAKYRGAAQGAYNAWAQNVSFGGFKETAYLETPSGASKKCVSANGGCSGITSVTCKYFNIVKVDYRLNNSTSATQLLPKMQNTSK